MIRKSYSHLICLCKGKLYIWKEGVEPDMCSWNDTILFISSPWSKMIITISVINSGIKLQLNANRWHLSFVKFQGHIGQKIANFHPNLAFPDCNSSLNSRMAFKWCTKLDVVQNRCPFVFRGHPSNFKITQVEKSKIWIQFEWDY